MVNSLPSSLVKANISPVERGCLSSCGSISRAIGCIESPNTHHETALHSSLSSASHSFHSHSYFRRRLPANPPASAESSDASQSAPSQGKDVPPAQPESGWYNPALSAKLSGMGIKSWGSLCPNFGDSLLGNAGGIRSKLADHGIAGLLSITATGWQNLLSEPSQTNGMQAYIGQNLRTLKQAEFWARTTWGISD
jgi:hypothetical protein